MRLRRDWRLFPRPPLSSLGAPAAAPAVSASPGSAHALAATASASAPAAAAVAPGHSAPNADAPASAADLANAPASAAAVATTTTAQSSAPAAAAAVAPGTSSADPACAAANAVAAACVAPTSRQPPTQLHCQCWLYNGRCCCRFPCLRPRRHLISSSNSGWSISTCRVARARTHTHTHIRRTVGSGPRYMICVTHFCTLRESKNLRPCENRVRQNLIPRATA